ncbi:hypothetical protein [Hyphomicrobium sp.]|uniref:hypothetical protein n=1 Tax=Hyphomicrobium sp. TaxID=82 RepID=UPI002E2F4FDD|nr:hypothetical protein [Hyphomicrobium sp.]HEX2842060.1 hypothetical protein [Hyphomicrobium sp.]
MKDTLTYCDIYLNNQRYQFDASRKVFLSSSGLEPRVVTMDAVKKGHVHAALWRAYVVGGVPYYYDEVRDELMRVGNSASRLGVNDYAALIEGGAVTVPRGDVFKAIMDRELAVPKRNADIERDR